MSYARRLRPSLSPASWASWWGSLSGGLSSVSARRPASRSCSSPPPSSSSSSRVRHTDGKGQTETHVCKNTCHDDVVKICSIYVRMIRENIWSAGRLCARDKQFHLHTWFGILVHPIHHPHFPFARPNLQPCSGSFLVRRPRAPGAGDVRHLGGRAQPHGEAFSKPMPAGVSGMLACG